MWREAILKLNPQAQADDSDHATVLDGRGKRYPEKNINQLMTDNISVNSCWNIAQHQML